MSNEAYGKWIATVKGEPNAKQAFAAGYEAGINASNTEAASQDAVDAPEIPAQEDDAAAQDETESSEDDEEPAKPKKKKAKPTKKKKR